MAKKFTFSRQIVTPEGVETFEACEFDSFDEAKKVVDKAVYERRLEIGPSKIKKDTLPSFPQRVDPMQNTVPVSTPQPSTPPAPPAYNGGNGSNSITNGHIPGNISNSPQGN